MNLRINKKIIISILIIGFLGVFNVANAGTPPTTGEMIKFILSHPTYLTSKGISITDVVNYNIFQLDETMRDLLRDRYGYSVSEINGIMNGDNKLPITPKPSREPTNEELAAYIKSQLPNTDPKSWGRGDLLARTRELLQEQGYSDEYISLIFRGHLPLPSYYTPPKESGGGTGTSEFIPLQGIPKVIDEDTAKKPSLFFNAMFNFGIIIAGFLAIVMITYGGIIYMSTDAVSGKSEGREIITAAIMGLLLILFSYILLKTINPDILKFNLFNKTSDSGGASIGSSGGTSIVVTPPTINKKLEADFQRWKSEQPDSDKKREEFEKWQKEFAPPLTVSDEQKGILFFKRKVNI